MVQPAAKQELRKQILALRKGMTVREVKERSRIICEQAAGQKLFRGSGDICLYMPINNEVDVTMLFETAWNLDKRVWLPRVIGSNIRFFSYEKETPVIVGKYGIREPDSKEELVPDERTLIVMPGAVFSRNCDRIGYGGGYYDRFLERNPACHTLALCYDFQIVDELPSEPHDKKPEVIISEEQVVFRDKV